MQYLPQRQVESVHIQSASDASDKKLKILEMAVPVCHGHLPSAFAH